MNATTTAAIAQLDTAEIEIATEMARTPDTTAFLASWGITVTRIIGRGWVILQSGVEVDGPQRTRRDAWSVGIAYAMGYMN